LIGTVCLGLLVCLGLALFLVLKHFKPKRPIREPTIPDTTKPIRKKPNPLLNALATICLLIVLYLIFFTDKWPLVVLFALIGLVFGKAARS
jgi:hypothetical protein